MPLDDPKLRYRVELQTDRQLRWFAQVEIFFADNQLPETMWTKSCETWAETMALAGQLIAEKRRGQ